MLERVYTLRALALCLHHFTLVSTFLHLCILSPFLLVLLLFLVITEGWWPKLVFVCWNVSSCCGIVCDCGIVCSCAVCKCGQQMRLSRSERSDYSGTSVTDTVESSEIVRYMEVSLTHINLLLWDVNLRPE